jgi:hypothetical protein
VLWSAARCAWYIFWKLILFKQYIILGIKMKLSHFWAIFIMEKEMLKVFIKEGGA